MSETNQMDLNTLYTIVLHESESDSVQELNANLYPSISEFIGKLKREEYDNIEAKIKNRLVGITADLFSLLIKIRIEKTISSESTEFSNLLDEEKFILDAADDMRERKDMIISAILNGKSKLLESISQKNKTKSVVVRFLKEMDEIVGVDLEKYGPFQSEDVATIPYENAQALISKNIAAKIRWED